LKYLGKVIQYLFIYSSSDRRARRVIWQEIFHPILVGAAVVEGIFVGIFVGWYVAGETPKNSSALITK